MILIHEKTAGLVWHRAVQKINNKGRVIFDENKKLKELLNVVIVVDDPTKEDRIIKRHGDKKMIRWMINNFTKNKPIEKWGYSYGQRINNFNGVNQLEEIIQKLRKRPHLKSSTITLMNPNEDDYHTPCICVIDFKIRKDKLLTNAFFRSQDAGKKIYADILSIGLISKNLARKLNVKIGKLTILVASLHFYYEDNDKLRSILETVEKP